MSREKSDRVTRKLSRRAVRHIRAADIDGLAAVILDLEQKILRDETRQLRRDLARFEEGRRV